VFKGQGTKEYEIHHGKCIGYFSLAILNTMTRATSRKKVYGPRGIKSPSSSL
jgi:hypothetical protein